MGCLKITYQQEVRQLGENHFFLGECLEKGVTDEKKGTNLYPFGSVASHWEKEPYRFGYQGQYAEQDKETGFDHFEARSWDSKIARWNSMDPARQYASGYMGMGNNPISQVDPDGRYSKFGALWRSGFGLRGSIYSTAGNGDGNKVWGFNDSDGVSHFGDFGKDWGDQHYSFSPNFQEAVNKYDFNNPPPLATGAIEPDHLTQLTLGFAAVGAVARTASFINTLEGASLRTGGVELSNLSATTTLYSRGSVLRAPAGGLRVGGKFYKGGQYYPGPRLSFGRGAVPQLQPSAAFINSAQPWAQRLINAPGWVRYGVGGGGSAALIYSEYRQFMNGKKP